MSGLSLEALRVVVDLPQQVAASVRFDAKAFENAPVPLSRFNDHAVRLRKEYIAESEHFSQAAGHRKNFRMCSDADQTAQNLQCHTVTRIAVDHAVKPGQAALMLRGIRSESMNENVDVWEYHGVFMTSSRSLERFRSTPGRTPPLAFDTGNSIRLRRPGKVELAEQAFFDNTYELPTSTRVKDFLKYVK